MKRSLPAKQMWEAVKKMNGDYRAYAISMLSSNNGTILIEQENILGEHLAHITGTANYSSGFLKFKANKEREELRDLGHENDSYNAPFSLLELQAALENCKATAVRSDNIHYAMLQHLPQESQETLLDCLCLFHKIYYTNHDLKRNQFSDPTYISSCIDHKLKVDVPSCRTNLCFNSLMPKTASDWNHLPASINSNPDPSSFKTAICNIV